MDSQVVFANFLSLYVAYTASYTYVRLSSFKVNTRSFAAYIDSHLHLIIIHNLYLRMQTVLIFFLFEIHHKTLTILFFDYFLFTTHYKTFFV